VPLTSCSFKKCCAFVSRTAGSGYDTVTSLNSWFKIDTRYRQISEHDSGVGETRGPGKITTGWILDSSGSIPDSMSWIPDSTV